MRLTDTLDKLIILADAAKYDAACTSSGSSRAPQKGSLGTTSPAGCCHAFSADGRCISLLKVLYSNACSFDCAYCVNRRCACCPRATFRPAELAELTVDFYKRNYIEGLFLSSAVLKDADNTAEQMIRCLRILRQDLRFFGYIHTKIIPGTSPELIDILGQLSDRLSVNLDLPSACSLTALCPDKDRHSIIAPMAQIYRERAVEEQLILEAPATKKKLPGARLPRSQAPMTRGSQNATNYDPHDLLALARSMPQSTLAASRSRSFSTKRAEHGGFELGSWGARYTLRPKSRVRPSLRSFAPAGQSTQLIIGATGEDDNHILRLSSALYHTFDLKRIFFSAYMPMVDDSRLPEQGTPVPLRREHRLYQADWLLRYYAFTADELVGPLEPWLDLDLDPKLVWALRNIERFPVEVMTASLTELLRIPGIGPQGARRIIAARRNGPLCINDLRSMRITWRRARYFLMCRGRCDPAFCSDKELIRKKLLHDARRSSYIRARTQAESQQLRLF